MLLNELQRQRQEFQQEWAARRALVGQGHGAEAVIPSATGRRERTHSSPANVNACLTNEAVSKWGACENCRKRLEPGAGVEPATY